MPPPRVRELGEMYELVEEILLLIPPEEPAVLIRASLVCKAWCRLLSGHAFRSRYRTLHKTPPVLGFLQRWEDNVGRSVPTTKFRPRNPERRDSYVLDCRHGRILLGCRWYDEGEEEADEQLKEEDDDIEEDGEGEEADKEEEEYDTDEEGEEDDEDEDEGKEDDRVVSILVRDPGMDLNSHYSHRWRWKI
ncbi:myelin transcription factor 1-like protein [Triticum urartu]|uniref:myelin transcription factor 1-like protein n=1 Tax=Triticum urartu TaxID=4572 RepID=UPI00204324C8|nr:myelin transcription factor 1-like protein [Triticum urartu]